MLALLKKFAWGPLMGIMQQREDILQLKSKQLKKAVSRSESTIGRNTCLIKRNSYLKRKRLLKMQEKRRRAKEEIIAAARAEAERLKESAIREIAHRKRKRNCTQCAKKLLHYLYLIGIESD